MDMGRIYDKDFRQQLMADPKKYYKEFSDGFLDDVEVVVKKNTKDINYIVMPSDSDSIIGSIDNIQAGFGIGTTGSIGSVFSAGSLGCVSGTGSTLSSASTMGTAGTNAV